MRSRNDDRVLLAYAAGYRVDDDGTVVSPFGRRLRGWFDNGYHMFAVRLNGEHGNVFTHRLAALQWFGVSALAKPTQVRHLNGNSRDNRRENIATGTASENMNDRPAEVRLAHARVAAAAQRKLTDASAAELRMLRAQGATYKELMARFGLAKSTVSYIVNGRTY